MTPTPDTFARRVVARRVAKGLTQQALAALCGCAEMTISRIERGQVRNVSSETLAALSRSLDISMDELLATGKRRSGKGA